MFTVIYHSEKVGNTIQNKVVLYDGPSRFYAIAVWVEHTRLMFCDSFSISGFIKDASSIDQYFIRRAAHKAAAH